MPETVKVCVQMLPLVSSSTSMWPQPPSSSRIAITLVASTGLPARVLHFRVCGGAVASSSKRRMADVKTPVKGTMVQQSPVSNVSVALVER